MPLNFRPWIGPKYQEEGLNGLKLLILGESHYGRIGEENVTMTCDIVRELGQKKRHRFFTTTAKLVLGLGRQYISNSERSDFWDRVSFSNYIQSFVAKDAVERARPTEKMWDEARASLHDIIEYTDPEAILILGIDMANRLPKIPSRIGWHKVKHPSQFFRYSDWQPGVQKFLLSVYNKV